MFTKQGFSATGGHHDTTVGRGIKCPVGTEAHGSQATGLTTAESRQRRVIFGEVAHAGHRRLVVPGRRIALGSAAGQACRKQRATAAGRIGQLIVVERRNGLVPQEHQQAAPPINEPLEFSDGRLRQRFNVGQDHQPDVIQGSPLEGIGPDAGHLDRIGVGPTGRQGRLQEEEFIIAANRRGGTVDGDDVDCIEYFEAEVPAVVSRQTFILDGNISRLPATGMKNVVQGEDAPASRFERIIDDLLGNLAIPLFVGVVGISIGTHMQADGAGPR